MRIDRIIEIGGVIIASLILLIAIALLRSGHHTIVDNGSMIIFKIEEKNDELGKYQYYFKDGSQNEWILRTDEKYNIGDNLVIRVVCER